MPKKRVHEIAKEQGITSKEVLAAFKDAGVYVKAASSTVEERDIRRAFPNPPPPKAAESPKTQKKADAKAEDAPSIVDRDSDGKAKVPRAKATKGAAQKKAESSSAKAAAKGEAPSTAAAEAPPSTQKTRAAGGSAAKAKAPGAPEKPAATADAAADADAAAPAPAAEAAK